MIDMNLPGGSLSTSDFLFRTGQGGDPGAWGAAPEPMDILVRSRDGDDGSDRVTLAWATNDRDAVADPNEAVLGGWLEVTVRATPITGLEEDYVFYVANLPADADGTGTVDLDDFVILKQYFGQTGAGTGHGDFDLSGAVDLDDFVILKQRFGTSVGPLEWSDSGGGAAEPADVAAAGSRRPAPLRRGRRRMHAPRAGGADLLADLHRLPA